MQAFPHRDIEERGSRRLYLRRYYLWPSRWFRLGLKLHRIERPDRERDLHDHPWAFLSIVLRGGYIEELPGRRYRWVRLVNLKRARDAHRIVHLMRVPTWTLVITFGRCREWGFHTAAGWVAWRDYEALADASPGQRR